MQKNSNCCAASLDKIQCTCTRDYELVSIKSGLTLLSFAVSTELTKNIKPMKSAKHRLKWITLWLPLYTDFLQQDIYNYHNFVIQLTTHTSNNNS